MAWRDPVAITLGINDMHLVDMGSEECRQLGRKLLLRYLLTGFNTGEVAGVGANSKRDSVQGEPTAEPNFS